MKNIILCLVFLLVGTAVYAQTAGVNGRQPREWREAVSSVKLQSAGTDYTDNTTAFTNLISTGNQATGNAGYTALMAVDSTGNVRTYYLWVDASVTSVGVLKMASFTNIIAYSSFPYGDWRSSTGFAAGIKVSSQ